MPLFHLPTATSATRRPGIAKQLSALYHSKESTAVPQVDIVSTRSTQTMAGIECRLVPGCTYVETLFSCLPVSLDNDLVKEP